MHVCWHRNLSVSMPDHRQSIKNQLSGYLLRKFKNSNGWQKLWVVFTNFCLFFYKTYQVRRRSNIAHRFYRRSLIDRMIFHWPRYLCWVTEVHYLLRLMVWIKITFSNYNLKIMFISSELRVNMHSIGKKNIYIDLVVCFFTSFYFSFSWMEVVASATVSSANLIDESR